MQKRLFQFLQVGWEINLKIQYLYLKNLLKYTKKFKNIEILWASTRETYNYLEAKKLGCQIITMPPKIIDQVKGSNKSFNQLTIDTVKGFYKDAQDSF